jgi:hypothetical protein
MNVDERQRSSVEEAAAARIGRHTSGAKAPFFLEAGSVRAKARTYLRGNGKYNNGITMGDG